MLQCNIIALAHQRYVHDSGSLQSAMLVLPIGRYLTDISNLWFLYRLWIGFRCVLDLFQNMFHICVYPHSYPHMGGYSYVFLAQHCRRPLVNYVCVLDTCWPMRSVRTSWLASAASSVLDMIVLLAADGKGRKGQAEVARA